MLKASLFGRRACNRKSVRRTKVMKRGVAELSATPLAFRACRKSGRLGHAKFWDGPTGFAL